MKYIRTEYGVYEHLNNSRITETGLWEVATDCGNEGFFGRFRGKVIKQADTIEELCDEFVIYDKKNNRYFVLGNFANMCKEYELYGAIWVIDSNGAPTLKPVAKANDKGELILL